MKAWRITTAAMLMAVTGLPTWAEEKPGESTANDGLTIKWEKRFLEVSGPRIPGGAIRTHYLEAYCRPGSTDRDWNQTVIPHESKLVEASEDKKRIEIEDRLADGVVVQHIIEAGDDEVTFLVTATNPTDTESLAHWAQPCMRVDRFTGMNGDQARDVYPPYIRKCFLMLNGKMTRLPTEPWALEARYVPGQVYAPASVDRDDVNPRPLSKLVPSSGLTGCYSADDKMILAIAWEPYQEIFQGVITCMHSDFRNRRIEAGRNEKNSRQAVHRRGRRDRIAGSISTGLSGARLAGLPTCGLEIAPHLSSLFA